MIYASHAFFNIGRRPYIVKNFAVATAMFFTLSGFMMTWCYDKCDFVSWKCKGQFLSRRFARLYPPLIVAWIGFLYLIQSDAEWTDFPGMIASVPLLYNAPLLCTFGDRTPGPIMVLWAISVEFIIYGIYVFVQPFLKQCFLKAKDPGSSWLWKLFFWGVIPSTLYTFIIITNVNYFSKYDEFSVTADWCNLYYSTWPRLATFFIGAIGGYFALHYVHPAWHRATARTKRMVGWLIDLTLILSGVIVLLIVPALPRVVWSFTSPNTLAPLTVLVLTMLTLDTGIIATCLTWKPLQELGTVSLEIYVLHIVVLFGFFNIYYDTSYCYYYTLPITIAICYVVHHYISNAANDYILSVVKSLVPSMSCSCGKRPAPAVAAPTVSIASIPITSPFSPLPAMGSPWAEGAELNHRNLNAQTSQQDAVLRVVEPLHLKVSDV